MKNYFARLWRDTIATVGGGPGLAAAILFPIGGAGLHFLRDGQKAMEAELYVWSLYVAWPLALYLAVVLLLNMACTPYRIQKDRAIAAERRVQEYESGSHLPNSVLRSLDESQRQKENISQQLTAISMLLEQYRRLLAAAQQFANFASSNLREDDVAIIASFLAEQTREMLPALPHRPDQPLVFQIGWNSYRYILSAPMARVPDVTFRDLPEGISARMTAVTRIHFDVVFWHEPSQNNERVLPPGSFILEAEL